MSRHTARIHVMNLIFQLPFHPEWGEDGGLFSAASEEYLAGLSDLGEHLRGVNPNEADSAFIRGECGGVFGNLAEIDAVIDARLKDWELGRLARIDLALLRLAVYEIRYAEDITDATAINEAIELAKVYGTDESAAFINGVLGQVSRDG